MPNASKKSLALLSILILTLTALIAGGVTLALLTDAETNSGSEVTAGTIDLTAKRDHGDYVPGPMFYPDSLDPDGNHPYDREEINPSGESIGGWAPGDHVQRTMIVTNEGSLDAKITGIRANVRESYTQNLQSGGSHTVTGLTSGEAYEEFIQKANVVVSIPDQELLLYEGPLADLIFENEDEFAATINQPVVQGTIPPFEPGPLNITFDVTLDRSAGNRLQGQNFIFDFGFYAEQVRNNEDGEQEPEEGVASGMIYDALNGDGLGGFLMQFREGEDTQSGEVVASTTTNEDGSYSISLPAGTYTAEVSGDGYITNYFTVQVEADTETPNQNAALSPVLSETQTRIVLTWGETPRDLDSHLTGPTSDGGTFHIYYGNKEYWENGELVAKLDFDDTNSYGPETTTVTINHMLDGDYTFYVHNWSGEAPITTSNAVVKVFQGSQQVASYNVPTEGEGRYWDVLKISGGHIIPINHIR